jgi:hypothetical protein
MNRGYLSVAAVVLVTLTTLVTLVLSLAWGESQQSSSLLDEDWPVFHHDPQHSGVAPGAGDIDNRTGPNVRWRYQVNIIPADAVSTTRWTSTFPLGDLDGDGTLEVVVTSPGLLGVADNHVLALKDSPGKSPPVERMWIITESVPLDMYSPALADANNDTLPDVIYATGDGHLKAVDGLNGQLIWEYDAGRYTEAGPAVGDLDDDGEDEVVLVTDCDPVGEVLCETHDKQARLVVLPVNAQGVNTPTWTLEFPAKLDSAVPALVDIDAHPGQDRLAIVAGTWGGKLLVAWQRPDGQVISDTFTLSDLATPPAGKTPAIRSSPLVWDFGDGPTAVFGWVLDPDDPADGRISAIRLEADTVNGTDVLFDPLWTEPYDAWKSSVTLLPVNSPPWIVAGYGLASGFQSGSVGGCDKAYLFGGVIALDHTGSFAWQDDFGTQAGNLRASAAVADVDGDGHLEVIMPVGCFGALRTYDGLTGNLEWDLQLGPRAQNSPSVGDIDGDGRLEIVVGSYDGAVWALDGGLHSYLPAITR